MASNFSLPTNISQPYELFTEYANEVTGGILGIFLLLMIFVAAFISMQRAESFKSPFTAASFVTMIIAILFRTLAIIPDWAMFVSIFMVLGGLASLIFSND